MKYNIELTLVDVGASLQPHPPFHPLLKCANYLAFDPDLREIRKLKNNSFYNYILINKAIVADASIETTTFYLTRNPTCSSTLKPKLSVLKNYLNAYRFEVVGEVKAPAIILEHVLDEFGLDTIDWLKLDTQGTDLRIINSLNTKLSRCLLAVDIEPGLDEFYEGEDTFLMIHSEMLKRGFWLSDISLVTSPRISQQVLRDYIKPRNKLSRFLYEFLLKQNPTAVRARYLRSLEFLNKLDSSPIFYLKLWACSFFSNNYPYALQVLNECIQKFGLDQKLDHLTSLTTHKMRYSALMKSWSICKKLSWHNIVRFFSKPD
jgi:FkbM family methyltransferase